MSGAPSSFAVTEWSLGSAAAGLLLLTSALSCERTSREPSRPAVASPASPRASAKTDSTDAGDSDAATSSVLRPSSPDAGAPKPFAFLPAISESGLELAVPIEDIVGPRVTTFMAVEILDVRRGKVSRRYVVEDGSREHEADGGPALVARTEEVLSALSRSHFRGLVRYDVHEDETAPERQGGVGAPFRANMAEGEGIVVRYREPWLSVTDEKGRTLLSVAPKEYRALGGAKCKGCPVCPPWLTDLRAVYGERTRQILLLHVGYRGGTDLCWEPEPVWHVVSWVAKSPSAN